MCWIDYDPVDNSIATNSPYALQSYLTSWLCFVTSRKTEAWHDTSPKNIVKKWGWP